MAQDYRFMSYTQLEKAYRRLLARRMPVRQKRRQLQTRYREIAAAVDVTAWIEKGPSDSLISLRPIPLDGVVMARPLSSHSPVLERITA